MINVLNLQDLFEQIHTVELADFPVAGQTRTLRFKKISAPDQLAHYEAASNLQQLKDKQDQNSVALFRTHVEVTAKILAKYLLDDNGQRLMTEEQALQLPIEYLTLLSTAMLEREKDLGEDSKPVDQKETSSDGSTGDATSGESLM